MKKLISILLIISTTLGFGISDLGFADDLSAAASAKAEYRLGPYDVIDIQILNHAELTAKSAITPDGQISLPLIGFVEVQGKTLRGLDIFLTGQYSAYIENPHLIINLTPKPIYVVQHDRKKNEWDVRTAKSIDEAKAYMGPEFPVGAIHAVPAGRQESPSTIEHGSVYKVNSGKEPDWWEDNWYKVLTATAVVVSIVNSTRKW